MPNGSKSGSFNPSTATEGNVSRQVQFGAMRVGQHESSSSSSSDNEMDVKDDDVNERLRHQVYVFDPTIYSKSMSNVLASVCTVTLQQCYQQVVILREVNNVPKMETNLDYVPLYEKYSNAEHDIDVAIHSENDEFLTFKKFKRDLSWIEKVFRAIIVNLQRNFYYDDLTKILNDDNLTKQEEQMLLSAKNFNQNELLKLKQYKEAERKELMYQLHHVTEQLGNAKDDLNDRMIENHVKINYLTQWENSRREQNTKLLEDKERGFVEITDTTSDAIDKEDRVHAEILDFLEISLEEYKKEIEEWMEKYDADLEEREQAVQTMKLTLEEQKDEHQRLLQKYNTRVQEMEDYQNHKLQLQREAEELEIRTRAAIKIQTWWRAIMKARHLGPYRKKKKKGKRSGSAKTSAKKKNKK